MQPLAGLRAVVTGAGTGIGAAVAGELARLGARLTLAGRRRETLEGQAATLPGGAEIAVLDVTDASAVRDAVAGDFDILVNNAGAAESAPFLKTDTAMLERMLAVNLAGAFNCAQAVLPRMLERRSGRIVNIASTAGVTGYGYVSAYCAAKHALVGLTRALAKELARSGVTVNAVCPGFTDTELVARSVATIVAKTGRSEEAARAELAAANPMGRLVTPEEVAATVGWLCLPQSASITGQAIVVAGGEVMS
jgi:NAD(P)-dependent dehydrogenase (short-subunit alcohol dehydrogenase family)